MFIADILHGIMGTRRNAAQQYYSQGITYYLFRSEDEHEHCNYHANYLLPFEELLPCSALT